MTMVSSSSSSDWNCSFGFASQSKPNYSFSSKARETDHNVVISRSLLVEDQETPHTTLCTSVQDSCILSAIDVRIVKVGDRFLLAPKNNFEMIDVETGNSENGNTQINFKNNFNPVEKKFVIKGAYSILMKSKNTEE
jgi:hypothetical protein